MLFKFVKIHMKTSVPESLLKKKMYILIWSKYILRVASVIAAKYFKIGVLKNFAIFTGKHLHWNVFLIKLQMHSKYFDYYH